MSDADETGNTMSPQPRQTGPQQQISSNGTSKAIALAVAIAVASSAATWVGKGLWTSFTDSITKDKADTAVVEQIKKDNDIAHDAIKLDVSAIRKEQFDQGRLMKRMARKLKVEE